MVWQYRRNQESQSHLVLTSIFRADVGSGLREWVKRRPEEMTDREKVMHRKTEGIEEEKGRWWEEKRQQTTTFCCKTRWHLVEWIEQEEEGENEYEIEIFPEKEQKWNRCYGRDH